MMDYCVTQAYSNTNLPRFLDEPMALYHDDPIGHTRPLFPGHLRRFGQRIPEPQPSQAPTESCRCEVLPAEGPSNDDGLESLCVQMKSTSISKSFDDAFQTLSDISIDGPTDSLVTDPKIVYRQDSDGDTLLHVAIIVKTVDKAIKFINVAPAASYLSIQNNLFQSPLHLAVLTNQDTVVRKLVIGGADLASRDKAGNTATHLACRGGNSNVIDALLNPVTDDEKAQNAYDIAYQNINQVLELSNYDGFPCLHEAAMYGHMELVRHLVELGADINSIDRKSGRTLLHTASVEGNVDVVKMLLSFPSCDINARAFDDSTPFDLARERGHHGVTYELAAEGTQRVAANSWCDP